MSDRSVYKSSTGVEVPLSFTGKHLLQNLREASTEEFGKVLKSLARNPDGSYAPMLQLNWEPISKARLAIAQHMSKLESKGGFDDRTGYAQRPHYLEALALARDDQLRTTLENRGYLVFSKQQMHEHHGRQLREQFSFPPGNYN